MAALYIVLFVGLCGWGVGLSCASDRRHWCIAPLNLELGSRGGALRIWSANGTEHLAHSQERQHATLIRK